MSSEAVRLRAFTLIELLVVVTIVALLLSILVPVMNSARSQMKQVLCMSNLRSLGLEFQFFAEGQSAGQRLGSGRIQVNDFQDYNYRINAFWDLPDATDGEMQSREELMLCAAGAPRLTKRQGFPCGREAILPAENVSIAVNMRLYRPVMDFRGTSMLAPVALSSVRSSILNHPYVPLLMDVDGREAVSRGLDPFYTAPPGTNTDNPYGGHAGDTYGGQGRFWMPSDRHQGKTNVAFVGGHVQSSDDPAGEGWNWDYQAQVGN